MRKYIPSVVVSILLSGLVATGANAQADPFASHAPAAAKAAPAVSSITPQQRQRLNQKLQLINQIMRAAERDMQAQQKSPEQRQWLLESMYRMPLEQVQMLGVPGTFAATADALARVSHMTTKALGSAASDLVYTPFVPCRFIDTRNVGGKISGARGYDLAATGTTYGGIAACNPTALLGIGDENLIGALALNITIVDTSAAGAPGFATVRPAGATQSSALVNWTVSSAGFQLGNAAVVSTDQSLNPDEFEIFTSGSVHAIVDLSGAFLSPAATALDCVTTAPNVTWNSTGNSLSNANVINTIDVPACGAGYTATAVIVDLVTDDGGVFGSCSETQCRVWTDHTHDISSGGISRRCCRVPGH